MQNLLFNKGTIIEFTSGEYSDFGSEGFLVTIQDVNLHELADDFRAYQKTKADDYISIGEFPSWLVAKGYAMPIDYHSVHLGSYGELAL